MKSIPIALIALLTAGHATQGAVVDLTSMAPDTSIAGSNVFASVAQDGSNGGNGSSFISGRLSTQTTSTVQFDDVAGTAKVVAAAVQWGIGVNQTRQRTVITAPPMFPNPNPTTAQFTDMITWGPITVSGSVELLHSTAATLTPWQYNTEFFNFTPTVTMSYPDSFMVTGTYKLVGPATTITTPFSVEFRRTSSKQQGLLLNGFINPGKNYPASASFSIYAISSNPRAIYAPQTATIFDDIVDGVRFRVGFRSGEVSAFAIIPEPTTLTLAVIALLGLRRRRNH